MIKYIYSILFSLVATTSFGQTGFPATQYLGNKNTMVLSRGGLSSDSGYQVPNFPDTTTANYGYLKNIPGLLIRIGDTLWMRSSTAIQWNKVTGINNAVIISNGLISGGEVTYTGTGLTFYVSGAVYAIDNVLYTSPATTITLSTADPTNPRFDVFYVDNTGNAGLLTGTADANPVIPQIDPATQVFLTSVQVPAGATTPSLTTEVVYDENVEWTGSASGVTVNFANTTNVYRGTISADVGATNNNDQISFLDGSTNDITLYDGLSFFIKLKQVIPSTGNIRVQFFNGATAVSNELAVVFDRSNTTTYQGISIARSAFTFSSNFVSRVRFRYTNNTAATFSGFYLDYVYLQTGLIPPTPQDYVQNIRRVGENVEQQKNGGYTSVFSLSDKVPNTRTITIANDGTVNTTPSTAQDLSANRTVTVGLPNTGVTAGSYTNANVTVDAQGRVTAAANGSGGAGTVTSVGLSMPSAFTVSNSPVTGSGTLTVSGAGTTSQYIRGDGTLATLPSAGITELTGDVTAGPGSGSQAATLANSGVTAGSYTNANITVDAKGRVTVAANGSGGISGSAANTHISYGSGVNSITGTANFRYHDASKAIFMGAGSVSSWVDNDGVIEINNSAIYGGAGASASDIQVLSNAYYDGAYKRKLATTASRFYASGGIVSIEAAATGIANSTITWLPALKVRSDARVVIGSTDPGANADRILNIIDANAALKVFRITSNLATSAPVIELVGASAANATFPGGFSAYADIFFDNVGFGFRNRLPSDVRIATIHGSAPANSFYIASTGNIGLNTATPNASALLHAVSTTKGTIPAPVMTSTQRNAIGTPPEGLTVYNSTDRTVDIRDNTRWNNIPNGLKGSAALDFASIAAGASATLTITVTGAADGDMVYIGVPNGSMTAGLVYTQWVSAVNTVSIQAYNSTAAPIDPASGTFRVYVIKN